jgi:hypothetical protein
MFITDIYSQRYLEYKMTNFELQKLVFNQVQLFVVIDDHQTYKCENISTISFLLDTSQLYYIVKQINYGIISIESIDKQTNFYSIMILEKNKFI